MIEPALKSVQCLSPAGLHRMAYQEWGDPSNPRVLVCVHGVTRVSDDFDDLARALAGEYRVVCPDVVGRGRSGRLRNPDLYRIPQYVSDMVTLLARVLAPGGANAAAQAQQQQVAWFGTSMGGLIGMGLASLPDSPIERLVLNDIGPVLDPGALRRIGDYIGQDVRFASFEEGARFVRDVSASFGPHTDAQWHKMARDVLRQDADGSWVRHYDLALAQPFRAATPESVAADEHLLWAAYDAIRCPTLLVRGAESDLLSHATAQMMTQRGPRARLAEFAGVGHAPTFVHADQIAVARAFLLEAAGT
ncbi:alpha/beta fold hydrolase [Pseudoduganella umbonata]|uniref:Alpha/beta hydrolase n=1 Tax=Pseudoduganella umbonata TaxID=864828 RepID=A0A4P8HQ31_9BURK|nr:alpha/beta hydrolase [Pseudoduganella umbonata]MBB3221402.1 pimeloyl-ACP methyl ester carboxylesterase [Pseudoduganella umbonata]QCP10560.1 alpha/beta hydrolase [Pseudoduganella umbonata]